MTTPQSVNFAFLATHDGRLAEVAARAEHYFTADPNTCLVKLRQLGELMARHLAAATNVSAGPETTQAELLRELARRGVLTPEVADRFHLLRRAGNAAVHDLDGSHREAIAALRSAHRLAQFFHRALSQDARFRVGAFVTPPDPTSATSALRDELAALREEAAQQRAAAARAAASVAEAQAARAAAEAQAAAAWSEVEAALELAEETEQQAAQAQRDHEARLAAVQQQSAAAPDTVHERVARARRAAADHALTEAETRQLIDAQLREAGWEVDTQTLTHAAGARPVKGHSRAIAEWPTANGPADYVLFVGLRPVGIVEAKRSAVNVRGSLVQAERYAAGFRPAADHLPPGGPWHGFQLPFAFATNGGAYHAQLKEQSGIWYRDLRRDTNLPAAVPGWPTPEGLEDRLKIDLAAAETSLQHESLDYLPLRSYQRTAIESVEQAIVAGQRQILLAMATGTGKTRTAICLCYRLVKSQRFRRVLFLVDRTSLGTQAFDSFDNLILEQQQTFTGIYDVKKLGDVVPDRETRLHFATVQGLVKRVLYPAPGEPPMPVDRYDCIIIDECHRGYTLDREMSDSELSFRSERDYLSKYRRVLEHFDAVRIGLTATPAHHTTEIFGPPVYRYTYREAVLDGHLVDYEPPTRIVTALAEDGISWKLGDRMEVYRVRKRQLDLIDAPDEVTIEVDQFNRQVITESFNRAVCEELARHIDPTLPGKTLIFCVTDAHADMVVRLLGEAFEDAYGPQPSDTVRKITGAADKPAERIRRFKNDTRPNVAVTVDLLTTGIDVPAIVNLVFLRRVKSRILYEQMIGRGTRKCPDIGKDHFRVFDAVDLYSALEDHNTMQPVTANPKLSFAQLVEELTTAGDVADEVVDELVAKLRRKIRRFNDAQRAEFAERTGQSPEAFADGLRGAAPTDAAAAFAAAEGLDTWLDRAPTGEGPVLLVSHHEDEVRRVERGYGEAARPEDYLESFARYLEDHGNELDALRIVTTRPRALTRDQLKSLARTLHDAGFSEARLRAAWRDATNRDIAASIVGFVRQGALGSPLVPYEERVTRAVGRILASRAWTAPQRQWLEHIGRQMVKEKVVDKAALDRGMFKARGGGFARLNKRFDGELERILGDLHEAVWEDAS